MANALTNAQKLADLLDVDVSVINGMADDLAIVAGDCLATLTPEKYQIALYYLTAFFVQNSQPMITSSRLGDASESYQVASGNMQSNPYGRLALQIAPCLIGLSAQKKYTVRLLA